MAFTRPPEQSTSDRAGVSTHSPNLSSSPHSSLGTPPVPGGGGGKRGKKSGPIIGDVEEGSSSTFQRCWAENELLGELVLRLKKERDAEREHRLSAEGRVSDLKADLEAIKASRAFDEEKQLMKQRKESAAEREELETLILELRGELDDSARKEKELRGKIKVYRKKMSAQGEGGEGGGSEAAAAAHAQQLEVRCALVEEEARAKTAEAVEFKRQLEALKMEAAARETLLEREIDAVRSAEEDEVARLRSRIQALEDPTTPTQHEEANRIKRRGRENTAIIEMHTHALALVRDRTKLLRRLHRADAELVVLKASNAEAMAGALDAAAAGREAQVKAAVATLAAELGLSGGEQQADDPRTFFLAEAPASLENLPHESILAYVRVLEEALVQARADCVILRERMENSEERERESLQNLVDTTDREANSAELLRVELRRAKETERMHAEAMGDMQTLEESKFLLQQEVWRLREMLAEQGINVAAPPSPIDALE